MLLIIHNPLSNNRKSKRTTNKWVRFFKRHQIPFMVRSSLKIDDLSLYLKNHSNISDILYLGGDGSINYLINHIDISSIPQRVFLAKSGSGNDFLRTLKNQSQNVIQISQSVTNNETVNFINGCGIGFDALVVHYVNNDINKSRISYFLNVFRAIYHYQKGTIDVTIDGINYQYNNAYFVAIQNGKYFGGGMKIAPKADPSKDTFQVCVAHNLNIAILLSLFPSIYFGFHTIFKKYIAIHEGKEIRVKVPSQRYFQADGEVFEDIDEITVTKKYQKEFIAFDKRKYLNEFKNKEDK